ncbi:hypothetical protein SAMN04489761_4329 [Tenacibaculum sp. MAR_2009_124]|uniref:hypothetical protein n=1 Tax=Tenacibaculum sp. MAR_2009_124 TaxID=1250059 RepID=UPI000899B690|nr:hypothetical protein [Tenacibaculum sp. MAR_2009_124]SED11857.1 hypothetical protein SAMN04489761_4329 [Tenacibaculum sp. MAR_2009_124]
MPTLHLNLHRKWFDMTEQGIKPEDYRELTIYWYKRLVRVNDLDFHEKILLESYIINANIPKNKKTYWNHGNKVFQSRFKKFDSTTLSNGYSKDRSQFEVKHKGINIGLGKEEWGAEPGKYYFVIKHGIKL